MRLFYKCDFSNFKLNEFPYDHDHSAVCEYHYHKNEGYYGDFYDPISLHQWRSQNGSWMTTYENGTYYMEQNRGYYQKGHFENVCPVLVLNKNFFVGNKIEFEMRMFSTSRFSGVAINYISSRNYRAIVLEDMKVKVFDLIDGKRNILKEKDYSYNCDSTYHFEVINEDDLKLYIDGKLVLSIDKKFMPSTKFAFISNVSSRYSNLSIYLNSLELQDELSRKEEKRLEEKQTKYSKLELIKKIDLKGNGAGRQFRYKTYNGKTYFLFAQHQKRIMRDSFARLSCLSCIDLDGNLLWQKGCPQGDYEHTVISCDLPFQIADINNDQIPEVIYAMDFKVYIVSLIDGKLIKSFDTPYVKGDPKLENYPFDRLNPDGMRVADFEGLGYKGDLILKDRYRNLFVYSIEREELLWRYYHNNTGHFPFVYDFNNDGIDELFVGYDMLDSKGNIVFSLPINSDHTDEILYLKGRKDLDHKLYLASGNEGFNIVNTDGSMFKSVDVGHAQRISAAHYDKTKDELLFAVTSFWGADNLVYVFDSVGNKLVEKEFPFSGNVVSPVSYDGVNDLILLNSSNESGLYDANLDLVVKFPNDNHPTLTSEAIDIDNDGISEIVTFDANYLYIYKAKDYTLGRKIETYPEEGMSNYRGEYIVFKGEN